MPSLNRASPGSALRWALGLALAVCCVALPAVRRADFWRVPGPDPEPRPGQEPDDVAVGVKRRLVETGVTSRERLGIMGASNGGLLMGAVLTQHPEIAAAVVCAVPVLDMLRSELTPNGAFVVTEFGSVRDPEMFRALYAYSPFHNVVDGTAYPPVLFTAGEFDPRVEAHHAKKMVARLQAATGSDQPILLRMESGGHGIGQSLDQQVELVTDYYAFYCDRLGVPYRARKNASAAASSTGQVSSAPAKPVAFHSGPGSGAVHGPT